ncbi:MAG: hypothetical protein H0W88_01685 [Parachlamydiaceae bacterium]|nr:hypothetical protein [Parachlamydiaceae bacterium]
MSSLPPVSQPSVPMDLSLLADQHPDVAPDVHEGFQFKYTLAGLQIIEEGFGKQLATTREKIQEKRLKLKQIDASMSDLQKKIINLNIEIHGVTHKKENELIKVRNELTALYQKLSQIDKSVAADNMKQISVLESLNATLPKEIEQLYASCNEKRLSLQSLQDNYEKMWEDLSKTNYEEREQLNIQVQLIDNDKQFQLEKSLFQNMSRVGYTFLTTLPLSQTGSPTSSVAQNKLDMPMEECKTVQGSKIGPQQQTKKTRTGSAASSKKSPKTSSKGDKIDQIPILNAALEKNKFKLEQLEKTESFNKKTTEKLLASNQLIEEALPKLKALILTPQKFTATDVEFLAKIEELGDQQNAKGNYFISTKQFITIGVSTLSKDLISLTNLKEKNESILFHLRKKLSECASEIETCKNDLTKFTRRLEREKQALNPGKHNAPIEYSDSSSESSSESSSSRKRKAVTQEEIGDGSTNGQNAHQSKKQMTSKS